MPAYSNTAVPNSVGAGDMANVWSSSDGNISSGVKTQRVALMQRPDGGATKLAWRVAFGGNPGAISLQLQTSDTDIDADFQSEGAAVTALGNNNEVRVEIPSIAARFARLLAGSIATPQTASVDFGG